MSPSSLLAREQHCQRLTVWSAGIRLLRVGYLCVGLLSYYCHSLCKVTLTERAQAKRLSPQFSLVCPLHSRPLPGEAALPGAASSPINSSGLCCVPWHVGTQQALCVTKVLSWGEAGEGPPRHSSHLCWVELCSQGTFLHFPSFPSWHLGTT